ncbi:hypothetical protein F0Q45_25355 [Mycobacterium simiae]|uniref:Uncharacterized protein n=1 Tax=Mycobacterium simiae TaxID=1784 RepID=A0A5B1B6R3_MYCSI|nr:hypothetical protein [Mycobacterium simiae]KAA1243812.1 hypothetical protein F0Q45_25355 [Mycobacterium simiae]
MNVPAEPDVAFAGAATAVAGSAISATATAILVIALRAPEAIIQFILNSSATDRTVAVGIGIY